MLKPVLQALLLADYVYQDKRTGKKIVAGIFHTLLVRQPKDSHDIETPAEPTTEPRRQIISLPDVERSGSPYVYISLTDVRNTIQLKLRYVSLETHLALFETGSFAVTSNSPIDIVEVFLPVPTLPPTPGVYALELLCEDEVIGAHRVVVKNVIEAER
ncbi:MAG: hypothetical protein GX621_07560 [Pirellulaceae bacterium]|nr:hypothetical protein [Pirellulaceae bacterium]